MVMDALLEAPLDELLAAARERRRGGGLVTYSPKVFIPLTTLCRDVCGYCTFARPPRRGERAFMTEDEVLAIARAGAAARLHARRSSRSATSPSSATRSRAPSSRRSAARRRSSTSARVREARARGDRAAAAPQPGRDERARSSSRCAPVSASMGIMLETTAERLSAKGGPHWASPDKEPVAPARDDRLAGELRIPFTSGILIGIGETRAERIEALLDDLRRCTSEHGHLQEVIVQNFRAKPGTRMASHPEPSLDDHLWTIAVARLLLPDDVARPGAAEPRLRRLPAPARRRHRRLGRRLAGDDRPRQSRGTVARASTGSPRRPRSRGLELAPRLPVYPRYLDGGVGRSGRPADGAARASDAPRARARGRLAPGRAGGAAVRRPRATRCRVDTAAELGEDELVRLFAARGEERQRVFAAADRLRREVCGDEVSYVVTRNIQYTNVCYFRCGFCAFSKGKLAANLRGAPYLVPLDEIVRRGARGVGARRDRGLPPGRHPPGASRATTTLDVVRGDPSASCPTCTSHAFSALEVWQGAATLGLPLEDYLERLRDARSRLAAGHRGGDPRRRGAARSSARTRSRPTQWLAVHAAAHRVGPALERDDHVRARRARRALGAPPAAGARAAASDRAASPSSCRCRSCTWRRRCSLKGSARSGPTFGESLLLHAVARLALHPAITNIQASWVKLGPDGVAAALARRRERSRRDADERVDLALGRLGARTGDAAGVDGGADPGERPACRASGRRSTRDAARRAARAPRSRRAPLAEPLNPPVQDAGLKAPPRLVRPGLLARAR